MSLVLHPDAAGLKRALAALASHAPVVMPTETVYGLAAGTLVPAPVTERPAAAFVAAMEDQLAGRITGKLVLVR